MLFGEDQPEVERVIGWVLIEDGALCRRAVSPLGCAVAPFDASAAARYDRGHHALSAQQNQRRTCVIENTVIV